MSDLPTTNHATVFVETESGNELIRSGEWDPDEELVFEEGERPFPDRKSVYEVKHVVEYDEERDIFDAVTDVFETRKAYETQKKNGFIQAFEKFSDQDG